MSRTRALVGLVALVALAACGHDIQDVTVQLPNAILELTSSADLHNVTVAQPLPVMVDASNVYLVDPGVAPPPEHVADAAHLVFTLDDESSTPLLVTSQTSVDLLLPPGTPDGRHKIICRVHAHDGTPTETTSELDITVRTTVASIFDAGVSADASTAIATPAPPPSPTPVY